MSELTQLCQAFIDQPLVERPDLGALRARNRRRRLRRTGSLSAVLAIAVLGGFGLAGFRTGPASPPGKAGVHLASYFEAGVSVPGSTLAAVGLPGSVSVPAKVTPVVATAASNGVVSYVGAEYCPFCALQRWALLVALSQFGTFTNLDNSVLSSSTDVYPDLASWSFVGAAYSSPYFSFDPTELTSSVPDGHGGYQPLQSMSTAQKAAFDHFDPRGGIPFVDFGNLYVTIGAGSSPSALEGLSLERIGADLSNPATPAAQAVDGTANYLIAAMCQMISGAKPAVCSSPTTAQALSAMGSGLPAAAGTRADQAPAQPPTDAPMSVWRHWSNEMHSYTERQAANYRLGNPGCELSDVEVTGTTLKKANLGVPAGVTVWAIDVVAKCNPKATGKR